MKARRLRMDGCSPVRAGAIQDINLNSDSSLVVSASSDGTAKVWQTRGGRCLQTLAAHVGYDETGEGAGG